MRFSGTLLALCAALVSISATSVLRADDPTVGDSVAQPPIIQGSVSGLALDASGNRYVTGTFYQAQDFNPGVGADVKTPLGYSDLFVTRFNSDGSYAWTQTVGIAQGTTIGSGLVVANGTIYVCGEQDVFPALTVTPQISSVLPSNAAIVVALDAGTGTLQADFGTNGIASYTGLSGASGAAIATDGTTLYTTGVQLPNYNVGVLDPPTLENPVSSALVWALNAADGSDTMAFGSNGVVVLSGIPGNSTGQSIALSNGSVYVAGSLYNYPQTYLPVAAGNGTGGATPLTATNVIPVYFAGLRNAFVASLDAGSGALNAGFGTAGIKQIGGTNSVTGNGLAVANGTVYVTGSFTQAPAPPTVNGKSTVMFVPDPYYYYTSNSDVYVLAIDAGTGIESTTFGTNGMIMFGRQYADQGVALAVSGGTVYVTGGYGDLAETGRFFYPLAGTGPVQPLGATANSGNVAGPNVLNGATPNTTVTTPSGGPPVNSFGVPNNISGSVATGPGAAFLPIYGFGGGGITDAFVLALDATTGARQTNFSGDGLQTFGGTGADGGVAIAVGGGNVYVAGYTYSTDDGIGGIGTIDATGFNSFLLTLDTATGGGGGVEQNIAPIVYAGDPQTVKIPEFPNSAVNAGSFEAWLDPTIYDDGLPDPPGAVTVLWAQVSGPGTVTFDDPTDQFTGVNFSTLGTYVLSVTADDSVLSSSDTTTITVVQNHAPVIDSGPTATPSTAATGDSIAFSVAAHDPDGDTLYYWWDFGDGGYGYGATPTYCYFAPGTYTIVVHVDDGVDDTTGTTTVSITGDPIFAIDNLQFCIDFSGKNRSSLSVSGKVGGLPKNFNPKGLTVALAVGGATTSFTLGANGSAKNAEGTFALRRGGKDWSYTAKLNSSAIETTDAATGAPSNSLGLTDTAAKNVAANVPVTLNIGAMNFSGGKSVKYTTANGMAKGK